MSAINRQMDEAEEKMFPRTGRRKMFLQLLPLGIGVLLFWAIYRDLNMKEVWAILTTQISFSWVLVSLLFGVLAQVFRAYLWRQLLIPLDVHPSFSTLLNSVFVNYGANILFPRLGEFLRPAIVARKTKGSFSTLLGSIVTERLLDTLIVGLMVVPALFIGSGFFLDFYRKHPTSFSTFSMLFSSYWFYLGLACLLLSLFFGYQLLKRSVFTQKIREVVGKLLQGVGSILSLRQPFRFVIYGVMIWVCYYIQFYCCFLAFPFTADLGHTVCFMAFFMGCLAGIVPIQGGIGPWHFAVISTLLFYGVVDSQASVFALLVNASQLILNAATGLYGYVREQK